MSIQEMKSRIYQLVDSINDEPALEQLLATATRLLVAQFERDFTDDLTGKQLAKIEKAREEVR